jgi:hypothetical protein
MANGGQEIRADTLRVDSEYVQRGRCTAAVGRSPDCYWRADRAPSSGSVQKAVSLMSRPNVTDAVVSGLNFARACVLDQKEASHNRGDHSYDKRYEEALEALDLIVTAHKFSLKRNSR